MKKNIYVASSWRNPIQQEVVPFLRGQGHDVYDYREPIPGHHGFGWSRIDPNWMSWTAEKFRVALNHPLAEEGFTFDSKAMEWATEFCIVLPCGNSAHLEVGWAVGRGKRTSVFWPSKDVWTSSETAKQSPFRRAIEPELMYKLAEKVDPRYFCTTWDELKGFHGVGY